MEEYKTLQSLDKFSLYFTSSLFPSPFFRRPKFAFKVVHFFRIFDVKADRPFPKNPFVFVASK
jgi:hypothetical protein